MSEWIDRLPADLKPVRPATRVGWVTTQWILFSSLAILSLFAAFMPIRPDWADVSSQISFWITEVSLGLLLIASAGAAIRSGLPGQSWKRAPETLGFLALLIFFTHLGFQYFFTPGRGLLLQDGLQPSGLECGLRVVGLAAVPALILGIRLKRTAPTQPRRSGVWLGLAAGAAGAGGLALSCASQNPIHLLVWHGLPILFISVLCGELGDRLLRW